MTHVHAQLPKPHDPFVDLVPPQGIKLTPRHYAYLKISEGCNHRCTFCIIPSMRGDLVSPSDRRGDGRSGALLRAGVKELLVVSQDTSAYGVDVRYATGFWRGRPVKTRMTELARARCAARQLGAWVRLHYVYPYPHVDDVIAADGGRAGGAALSRRAVPAREPAHPQADEAAGGARAGAGPRPRVAQGVPGLTLRSTFIVGFPGETEPEFEELLAFLEERSSTASAASPIRRSRAPRRMRCPIRCPDVQEARSRAFMAIQARISAPRLAHKVGTTQRVLIDGHGRSAGAGGSDARSP